MKKLLIVGGLLFVGYLVFADSAVAAGSSTASIARGFRNALGFDGGGDVGHPKRPLQCLGGGGYDQTVLIPSISSDFKLSFNIGTIHDSIPRTCARQED